MGEVIHGDGSVKAKCLKAFHSLFYPRKGFEVILWLIIVAWIGLGLSVSYNLWYWQMDMTKERQQMQNHIQVLQDIIKNHGGSD